ncbi:hypothetical protein HPC49_25705 [Pyxidicoccus fallax]|uniref:Uncharacterized protein n=1 Tax=Pyxidicoccus fallax TaxID=394095 RepID=A0A848LSN2_9BACT|nr:hypothetical protein [Pyxidicoccus fallax]NMO20776.1 hypothetical protein [Pyxidicoccus fallax]NPC81603.1 hypothetical protein [Pyxidicoccus fallax]
MREVFRWRDVHLYGVKGQAQHGIDLYGYMPDGEVRTCQGKDVETFDKGALRAAINKFTEGKRPFRSHWLAVAVACGVERTEVLEELHALKKAHQDLTLELWDQNHLSEFLRAQHTLVRRFFGPEWERVFCDPLPASARPLQAQEERQQRLEAMRQESRARLITRWISAGLGEARAEEFAAEVSLGLPQHLRASLPETGLVVLEGDFGSGKSTAGERLHQEDLERALADVTAPVPVYLTARYVQGPLKEAVLAAATGQENPTRVGARIVLDGIDEAGMTAARQFIEQARVLVRQWPHTRCLLTARPLDIINLPERVHMRLLEMKEVEALVRRVAGTPGWARWPASVWETARRPLFALVAASLRNTEDKPIPRSTAGFLEALVQGALERTEQLKTDAHTALQRLAALTLSSGGTIPQGEFGAEPDIQPLLTTALVVRRGRTLSFTLPVIEQYFGAQALLTGVVKPDTAWASLASFDRWRDAVVIAVGSGSWERTSALLIDLAGRYPGAASWVVEKALSEHFSPAGDKDAPDLPDGAECARRLRTALAVWIEAVKPLSERTRLVGAEGRLVTIAARCEGARVITVAWPPEASPTLVSGGELPRQWQSPIPEGALWKRSQRVDSTESAWPWKVSLRWLREEFEHVLSSKALPLRDTSPNRAERRWAIARLLMDQHRNLLHPPISADVALTKVRQVLTLLAGSTDTEYVTLGGRWWSAHPSVQPKDLREFASDLEAGRGVGPDGRLHRPWAVPDRAESPRSRWGWGLYSREAQLRFVQEVYPAALDIYEEAVTTWMPRLGPTLDWACALPIRLTGIIEWDQEDKPSLHYYVSPLPLGAKTEVVVTATSSDSDLARSLRSREDIEKSVAALSERSPAAVPWFRHIYTDTRVHLSGNTPATDLAYKWIAYHLQHLSLVTFGYRLPESN